MSGIDLYAIFAVDSSESGTGLAARIHRRIDGAESRSWDAEKKRLAGYAATIFADEDKRRLYDQALQSPFAPPEVTEEFLKELATSTGTQGQSYVDAPRDQAFGAPMLSGSTTVPAGAVRRTVTQTLTPVQPLAVDASLKDAWVRTPRTIRGAIGALGGLAIFILLHRIFDLIDAIEYFSYDWAPFLSSIGQLVGGILVIGAICLNLLGGFSSPGRSRHFKVSLLVMLGVTRLFAHVSAVMFIFAETWWPSLVAVETYPESLWEMAAYFGLPVLALILCLLPQSLAWYRGMTLVKTVS